MVFNTPQYIFDDWIRPVNWLPIPTISEGEEVVYIINKVYDNDTNFAAVLCQGNYTVDWGDGNVENVNTNVKAEHSYVYSAITSTVINNYKQVLIKITPQAGQNLTVFNLQQYHSSLTFGKHSSFQEITISLPSATTFSMCNSASIYHSEVENIDVKILNTAIVNATRMFQYLYNLKNINFKMEHLTDTSYMFYQNQSLRKMIVNVPLSTNTSYMFYYNYALKYLELNAPSTTTTAYCCVQCYSLNYAKITTSTSLTIALNTFQNCNNLKYGSISDTTNVTNLNGVFQNCFSLKEIVFNNLNSVTSTSNSFVNNYSLSKLICPNLHYGFTIAGASMGPLALNDLFTSMGNEIGTQTIIISNNWGRLTCDTSIATAKGYAVTV